MRLWKYPVFSFMLIVLFQNCTQGEGMRSRAYVVKDDHHDSVVVADEDTKDEPPIGTLGEGSTGEPTTGGSAYECFQNYISIFEWKNPNANLMNERPVISENKITTLRLNSNGYTYSVEAGWAIEGSIRINSDGSSSTSVHIQKEVPNSLDSLDCYFMRVATGDNAVLADGKANVLLPNIGSDPSANIFAGFIRHPEQFIACRVSAGKKNVELKNANGGSQFLTYNQSFVIKRGCFASDLSPIY